MVDPKKMSVEDILAACRGNAAGAGGKTPSSPPGPAADAQPGDAGSAAAPAKPAAKPVASKPAAAKPPGKPGAMSVADILAAARGGGGAAGETPAVSEQPAPAQSAAAAKPPVKPGSMSVADILAAARTGAAKPAAEAKPAPAAPKPAAAKPAAAKPAAAEAVVGGPKDTSSILAAARKGAKPGPMTKEEAKQRGVAIPEKSEKAMPVRPEKPAYAIPKPAATAAADRRSFLTVLTGSFMAVGFSSLTLTNLVWGLGLARFMFPNVLTEPPSKFKVGFPADFAPDAVSDNFKAQFGVWVVNTVYEGQRQIFALRTVCTHLGCTPNWLEAEQKFKCPCHGSGFYKDGVNFEGPAPRPLERYAIVLADDGQLEIDKSRVFHWELGEWGDGGCFVPV